MKLLDPRTWFTKASAVGQIIAERGLGQPVWSKRNYQSFAKEAYQLNAVSYRCIKLVAGNAAGVKWLLVGRDGKVIDNHPLIDLLRRPTPLNSGRTFFEAVYAYLLIAGNSYIEANGPEGGKPGELWVLRPDRMKVVPGKMSMPEAFEYSVGGKKHRWPVNQVDGTSPILHLKEFHPTDDWYGLSRVEAAAYGIDRHNAASAHNKALLDNGARPSGALVFEPVTSGGESQNAPKEIIEAAEKQLMARHGGPTNAGRPMIFGGNVRWEAMGFKPRDMDYAVSKDDSARDICIAFGVPPVLVVKGEATYNNMREAKLDLYEDTVLPLVEFLTGELNTWLVPPFGDGLRLVPDLDSVSALESRRETKRRSTVELLKEGVISHDEARSDLDYGPRDPDAVGSVDGSTLSALVAAMPEVGIMPLARYMRSVQLVPPDMSDEEILAMAMDLIESDPINDGAGDAIQN